MALKEAAPHEAPELDDGRDHKWVIGTKTYTGRFPPGVPTTDEDGNIRLMTFEFKLLKDMEFFLGGLAKCLGSMQYAEAEPIIRHALSYKKELSDFIRKIADAGDSGVAVTLHVD